MSRTPDDPMPESRVTVDADVAHLATLRAHVAKQARAYGAPENFVEQFELVVSELATNVMQHTDAPRVTVAFARVDRGWLVDVSDADGLARLDVPVRPDPAQLSGRGLFLVQTMMDEVELIEIGDEQHIRCLKYAG